MKPLGDRTRGSDSARHRRWAPVLVILVAAISLGTQPARSGDAVQAVQPSAIAGPVRPLDLVKSSVSNSGGPMRSSGGGAPVMGT
jgi:hypothetical protein